MKYSRFALPALILSLAMFAGTSARSGEETKPAVAKMDVVAASEFVAQHSDAVIMDVRTAAEFDLSHITGAININVQSEDFASLVANLDRDKTYLVHCTRNPENGRSSRALETLQGLGFKNLLSLEGGYVAWKEADLPLTESGN